MSELNDLFHQCRLHHILMPRDLICLFEREANERGTCWKVTETLFYSSLNIPIFILRFWRVSWMWLGVIYKLKISQWTRAFTTDNSRNGGIPLRVCVIDEWPAHLWKTMSSYRQRAIVVFYTLVLSWNGHRYKVIDIK